MSMSHLSEPIADSVRSLSWHLHGWRARRFSVSGRHGTGRVARAARWGTGADGMPGACSSSAPVDGWLYADRRRRLWYGRGVVCTGHDSGWRAWLPGCADGFCRPGRAGARGRGAAGGLPASDGDRAGRLAEDPADRGGSRGGRRVGSRTGRGWRQRRTPRGWPAAGAGTAAAGHGGMPGWPRGAGGPGRPGMTCRGVAA
jgi:hypothetical protein